MSKELPTRNHYGENPKTPSGNHHAGHLSEYLYVNAHSLGNKHVIRDLRVPRVKTLDERRTQERWLIFENNLLQAQEHAHGGASPSLLLLRPHCDPRKAR